MDQQDRRQPKPDARPRAQHRPQAPSRSAGAPIRTFKDLVVWQKAFRLALEVHRLTTKFPPEERYGLTAELRKTARSVAYNIAEGHRRGSTAEYLRFLAIAAGSAAELETQLLLARELGHLRGATADGVVALHAEVDRMLDALARKLRSRNAPPT